MVFFTPHFIDTENFKTTATIRFSNADDGLIPVDTLTGTESLHIYPRTAPENGYDVKTITLTDPILESRVRAKHKQPLGYLFRIRTVRDKESGRILSANYGKIVAPEEGTANVNPFELISYMAKNRRIDSTPGFRFSSYLNPTPNDRNLEYDQHNNLAPEVMKGGTYFP